MKKELVIPDAGNTFLFNNLQMDPYTKWLQAFWPQKSKGRETW